MAGTSDSKIAAEVSLDSATSMPTSSGSPSTLAASGKEFQASAADPNQETLALSQDPLLSEPRAAFTLIDTAHGLIQVHHPSSHPTIQLHPIALEDLVPRPASHVPGVPDDDHVASERMTLAVAMEQIAAAHGSTA
ncbi:MAG: hypothetical protein WDW38_010466 [Sanguina aurantia]